MIIPDGSFTLRAGDKIALTAPPTEIVRLLRQLGQLQKSARDVMLLGGSRIAYYLSKMLLAGGHSVKLIERDRARCQEICAELPQAVVICGDGARQEVLIEEGLGHMNAFVALTGTDEANILLSIFAVQQKVPKVIAKVDRTEHAAMAERLGLDCIVSPKNIISDRLASYARALENADGSKIESLYKLMDDRAEALEFIVTPDFPHANKPLRELRPASGILIAGIIRGRRTIIPSGDDVILPGDRVIVLSSGKRLGDLGEIVA